MQFNCFPWTDPHFKLAQALKSGRAQLLPKAADSVKAIARGKIWRRIGTILILLGIIPMFCVWGGVVVYALLYTFTSFRADIPPVLNYVHWFYGMFLVLGFVAISIAQSFMIETEIKILDDARFLLGAGDSTLECLASLRCLDQQQMVYNNLRLKAHTVVEMEKAHPSNPLRPFDDPHPHRIEAKRKFEDAYNTLYVAGFIDDVGYGRFFKS